MAAIMADHDCERQMQVLLPLTSSGMARALDGLAVRIESFASLGCLLIRQTPTCGDYADNQIILITGNRNEEDQHPLEATLQASNTPTSLPLLTLSEPQRVLSSRAMPTDLSNVWWNISLVSRSARHWTALPPKLDNVAKPCLLDYCVWLACVDTPPSLSRVLVSPRPSALARQTTARSLTCRARRSRSAARIEVVHST